MASKAKQVGASTVKAWASEQGISEGFGSRGRVSGALVQAFNDAHKGKAVYTGSKPVPMITVTGKSVSEKTGRKTPVTRSIPVSAVRAATSAQRGRFSRATLLSAAGLVD